MCVCVCVCVEVVVSSIRCVCVEVVVSSIRCVCVLRLLSPLSSRLRGRGPPGGPLRLAASDPLCADGHVPHGDRPAGGPRPELDRGPAPRPAEPPRLR